jgi:hypothetical protein
MATETQRLKCKKQNDKSKSEKSGDFLRKTRCWILDARKKIENRDALQVASLYFSAEGSFADAEDFGGRPIAGIGYR